MSSLNDQNNDPGTEQWSFETGGEVRSSPTVVNGTVYAGSNDNYLYAVDAATGAEKWRFKTRKRVEASPTVVDGTVFVGSHDGNLYAVDTATGAEQWNFRAGSSVSSSPEVANETVYVSGFKKVCAVNAANGTQNWVFEIGDLVRSSPTVRDGTVYVGSDDGNLYAVNMATGTEEWTFETEGEVRSSPTVVDGTVYIGSDDRNLYAVDAATGTEEWYYKTEYEIESSPTVVDGTAYVGRSDIYAVDVATGTEERTFEIGWMGMVDSSPVVVDGMVYLGSSDNHLYAMDAATGAEQWNFRCWGSVSPSPTVVDGTVYVESTDANLYAITASAGPETCGSQQSESAPEAHRSSNPEEPSQDQPEGIEAGAGQVPSLQTVRSPERRNLSREDFQTTEKIGSGGQAVIQKARLIDSKTPPEAVALREPAAAETLTQEAAEEFFESAETWATIDARERDKPQRWEEYEHIVGVIDTGDSLPWIAMEYMEGGDLTELLREHPDGLPVGQALWIGECVCKGLEIAHQLGRVHLDVKPGNVLLKQTDGWPWPKLADWGLARTLARETGTMEGRSVDTPAPSSLMRARLATRTS